MSKADKYRIIPSSEAHYGPGKFVVQRYYPDLQKYFDVGDPVDTREEAEAKLAERRAAEREDS